jgi:hypothetical protein
MMQRWTSGRLLLAQNYHVFIRVSFFFFPRKASYRNFAGHVLMERENKQLAIPPRTKKNDHPQRKQQWPRSLNGFWLADLL